MDNSIERTGFITQAGGSIRIVLMTMIICCLLYPLVILGIGQTLTPNSANGSLVSNDRGEIVGSKLIAQKFERPEYFWPRPSAVDYNAAAAGAGNLSPANPEFREGAKTRAARLKASADDPVPADLVTASGSGLDPDITLTAAKYQAGRVALARDLSIETIMDLLDKNARRPGVALTPEPLVNVLLVNMALDRLDN